VDGVILLGDPRTWPACWELRVKRREFVVSGGMVGAGLWGAASLAPGVLRAAEAKDLDSNFNSEEKPVAFSVPP